jgi:subtilase family serine protease
VSRLFKLAAPFVTMLALAACNATGGSPNVQGGTGQVPGAKQPLAHAQPLDGGSATPACQGSRIGMAQCDVLVRTATGPNVSGYGPADLEAAYNLPSLSKGSGQIVAIVDAFDNPNVTSDLGVYRSNFGLGTATFTKYNQVGQTNNYPTGDIGWGVEIDLDVQMVSASCPLCTIYLVEANSNNWSDIQIAEAEAVKLGATVVSNSYGGTGADQSYYDTPHVTYLASSGDSGFGIADPADFPSVVSVGGTELLKGRGTRGWTETVWFGSGAGCSTYPKPKWQHDPGCSGRTANDVSAVADPQMGVAEYDSYGEGGWFVVGGTSVSSPLLGGAFGLAGNSTVQNGGRTFWVKTHQKYLYPILSGGDGSCSPTYLCQAGTKEYGKYSGPGGWGTPNGIGAF